MLKRKTKFHKLLLWGVLVGFLTIGMSVNVYAEVESIVLHDSSSNVNYQYDMDELLKSIRSYNRTGQGVLYEDFQKTLVKKDNYIISYYDNKNEYIDYKAVLNGYKIAKRYNKSFDFNAFCESDKAVKIEIETEIKTEENGEIVIESNDMKDFRVTTIQ